jgi:hypothetical protein
MFHIQNSVVEKEVRSYLSQVISRRQSVPLGSCDELANASPVFSLSLRVFQTPRVALQSPFAQNRVICGYLTAFDAYIYIICKDLFLDSPSGVP